MSDCRISACANPHAHPVLKPCPFCGHEAQINDYNEWNGFSEGDPRYTWSQNFAAGCNFNDGGCGASGGFQESPEKAAEAWNMRCGNED